MRYIYLILLLILAQLVSCAEEESRSDHEQDEPSCMQVCGRKGYCEAWTDGSCRAGSDEQCRASEDCDMWGLCHMRHGYCVALSVSDCNTAGACYAYNVCEHKGYCCLPDYDPHGMCRCGSMTVWDCPGEGGFSPIEE
jgi:hypothetical protein